MLTQILTLLAFLISTSSAQSETVEPSSTDTSFSSDPVVSLFLPMADPQPLVASLISLNPSLTTYLISCPSGLIGEDTANCGFDPPQTVTEGPSTVAATLSVEGYFEAYSCKLSGTTAAVCITSASGKSLGSYTGEGTTTLMQSEVQYLPVTITDGGKGISNATTGAVSTSATDGGAPQTRESSSVLATASGAAASTSAASTTASGGGSRPPATSVTQATVSSTGGAGSVAKNIGAVGAGLFGALAALI